MVVEPKKGLMRSGCFEIVPLAGAEPAPMSATSSSKAAMFRTVAGIVVFTAVGFAVSVRWITAIAPAAAALFAICAKVEGSEGTTIAMRPATVAGYEAGVSPPAT
jgi:hypothetical protein